MLIVPKLCFNVLNGWHTIDSEKIFDLNNVSIRLWVTEKIRVDCKPSPETNFVYGAPTIYKDDAKKLVLLNNKFFFENYMIIASNREDIYLENVAVINEDDSIVPLEKMIEVSPNIKEFTYKINELSAANIILPDTVKNLIAIPHFSNLDILSLYSVPESFDMESFFVYVKENRDTEIWLWFQDDLSYLAYLNRLQEIVDEIISTENREYKAPWIYFDGMTEASNDNLYALYSQDFPI